MFDNKNSLFVFSGITIFLALILVVSIYYWPCQVNKKIDNLTLFVSNIQSDYSNISKDEWELNDTYLEELIMEIESCTSELTDSDRDYIEKQKSIYEKVKIKWRIENVFNFN